ncbi:hypothetical protein [Sinomonas sp. G460-2]|uniref:hypothetical protein n=1 Tax=Sinomonas sp. G460-2 TaxID=3393464 RepID=UPI0039EE745B
MKVYHLHVCGTRHRSVRTFAKCLYPRAAYHHGDGEYAVLNRCRKLRVNLFETEAEAQNYLAGIKTCFAGCVGAHELVHLATSTWEQHMGGAMFVTDPEQMRHLRLHSDQGVVDEKCEFCVRLLLEELI